jgi:hypothetical protein
MADAQAQPQPNIALSGDEARILMAALRTTNVGAPIGITLNLFLQLSVLSQVQPPVQQAQGPTPNEG